MSEELWKDIKNYEGYYQISSRGKVKSCARIVQTSKGVRNIKERILKSRADKDGYLSVILSKNSKPETCKIHRLVAQHFLKKSDLPQVNHKDGDKKNNNFKNLEWVDNLKNTNHYHTNNSTKKYGVHRCNNKWRARIKKDGKSINIGFFTDKEKAYQAFYNKYLEIHGVRPW